jgi:hypothetical protein
VPYIRDAERGPARFAGKRASFGLMNGMGLRATSRLDDEAAAEMLRIYSD